MMSGTQSPLFNRGDNDRVYDSKEIFDSNTGANIKEIPLTLNKRALDRARGDYH